MAATFVWTTYASSALNPDLVGKFENESAALTHYQKYGAHERRLISADQFDAAYYLARYADVAGVYTAANAINHYVQFGIKEGRIASESQFDATSYLANNLDVQAAVTAGTIGSALVHYSLYGFKEGRLANYNWFDAATYLANNADVASGWTGTALEHFNQYGRAEGRAGVYTPYTGSVTPAGNVGQTYTLTTGADTILGTDANDTIVGTEATLTSGDAIDGKNGIDWLRVANSGPAKTFSAFTMSNVEGIQVTADGTGATTFDVTDTSGVLLLSNNNSSQDMTFTGANSVVNAAMSNVTAGNTTVVYKTAAVAGSTDAMTVMLTNNLTIANGAVGTLTANGIETFNVLATGGASKLTAIASNTLKAMTVAGDKSLTLGNVDFTNNAAVNTLDARGLTGTAALDVTLGTNTATIDVAVSGGDGDDRANFSTGFDTGDSFAGGNGRDTIALTQAVATAQTAATGGTVSAVEVLEITNGGTGTTSLATFAGVDTVFYSGLTGGSALAGASTITNATTGLTVRDNVDAVAQNLTATLATNGATDVINFSFEKVGAADALGTVSAAQFETINITTVDDAAVAGVGVLTIANLVDTVATTINISGDAALTITAATNPATPVLTALNAGTATGALTISGVDNAAAGAYVTLGAGNDTYSVAVSSGADTIDLSKGGNDTIVYTTLAQSGVIMDTVKGFVSGSDAVDLRTFVVPVVTSSQFVGTKASFGEAQGALTTGGASAVFDASSSILWVDNNGDGTLDARDFRVKLEGVTAITAADLKLTGTGNTVTLSAAGAVVNLTTKTNADAFTTNEADTINSSIAALLGSTIDGAIGNDTLVLTTAGAVGALAATITNVEALTLATVGATANTAITFAGGGAFKHVTGSANADTIASTANMIAGGTIALGAGNDIVTALAADLPATTIDLGAGDDSLTSTIGGVITATLTGGDGADTLVLAAADSIIGATVTGFENLTTGATSTMTGAQLASFTGVINNGGAMSITGANNTVAGGAGLLGAGDTIAFTTAASTNTVTLDGNSTATITGNTGVDTVTGTDVDVAGLTLFAAAGGADVLNITAFDSAIDLSGKITDVETINLTGTGGGASSLTLTNTAAVTLVDGSALTTGGFTYVSGAQATAGYTVKGSAFADVFNNATTAVAATYWMNNGDSLTNHRAFADTFNLTANATGTTTVTIVDADGEAAKDTIKLFNPAGTQVNVAGFVNDGAAFTGTGVISARAHDDGANTVVQIDLNGDGLWGTGDVQVNLSGVSAGAAGEGNTLFSIVGGGLVIL